MDNLEKYILLENIILGGKEYKKMTIVYIVRVIVPDLNQNGIRYYYYRLFDINKSEILILNNLEYFKKYSDYRKERINKIFE